MHRFSAGLLTPDGEGGLAVFRLDGDGVPEVLDAIFRPKSGKPRKADVPLFGTLFDGDVKLDEAVVRVHATAPTARADISVHGGAWVSGRLEALFARLGGGLLRREASQLLERAVAPRQVSLALALLSGTFTNELASIRASIASGAADAKVILPRVETLVARGRFGLACASPPTVSLVGVPNAGKSTLFNALCGENRAVVAPRAGTTRDRIEAPMIAGDDAVALVDGAGLRDASDPVERAGVALAVESAASADALIAAVRADLALEEQESTLTLARNRAAVHVVTMGDVADPNPVVAALARRGVPALVVARGDARSLETLRRRVVAATPLGAPFVTAQPMPWLPRHLRALGATRAALEAGARAEAVRELDLLLGDAS